MKLLWKLLLRHLSRAQLLGFALAGAAGMTVLLGAFQAYRDIGPMLTGPDSFLRGDFLVLSKRIGALQTLGLGGSGFSPEELDELRAQPFVRAVGAFTPAEYRITGSVGAGSVGFSTYLFFESVPDRFLDVDAEAWGYEPGGRDIPIIIPRTYVNLYNYGFAGSQGLPQLSEGVLRRVGIGIELAGNGLKERFRGRIVGLTDRLNTILVPESFIRWSNGRFGGEAGVKPPSRVIVETDRPVDASVEDFLARKGYEAEGDRRDAGKASRFVALTAAGAGGVGLAFSALAFFVLLLSVLLLLQKNGEKLENLLLVGVSPARAARPYQLLTLGLNLCVSVTALMGVWLVRRAYLPRLTALEEGLRPAGMGWTIVCGIALSLLLSLLSAWAIRRRIDGLAAGRD